jgi:hypothetical protein
MPLETKTLAEFVTDFINQFATQTGFQPVLAPGSPILAIAEAESAQAMFLQFQAQFTTLFARSTTCTGPDLDSFYAQFNFPRAGASFANGSVTLSIASPANNNITVAAAILNPDSTYTGGTIVQTIGGAIQYQLIPDINQTAYNIGLNAYVLPAGQTSITATANALVAGSASNVQAGQLIQFGSSSSNITFVNNPAPISNGSDHESDNHYRARFILYITSLSKATYNAILETCETLFPDYTFAILSNVTPSNIPTFGYFTVVVNNPGGTVPSGQLITIATALEAVRAFTVQDAVIAAHIHKPPIQMSISVSNGADFDTVSQVVQLAVIGYVNSLPSGAKLYLSNLIDAADNASQEVTSIDFTSVTINGIQANYTVDQFSIVQADLTTVAINEYDG